MPIIALVTGLSKAELGVNHFARIILTKSKLIAYSSFGKINRFELKQLAFEFQNGKELFLKDTSQDQGDNVLLNISKMSFTEKNELRDYLTEMT